MSFSKVSREVALYNDESSSKFHDILPNKNQFPLTQYKQNSSSRSSSAHNKNLIQISASNSKTTVPSFSSINSPNEINVWNSHKHSINYFTDLNGKPITYDHNQHTHSPRQYTSLSEAARISHHSNSSSGKNFLLSKKSAPIYQHFPNDTNSSSNWQNEFDKADLKRNSNELTYQDFDQIGSNAKIKSNIDRDKYSEGGAGSRQNSRFHGDNYFSTNSADIYGTMPEWNDDYQSRNRDLHSELDRHERGIEIFGEEIEDLRIRSNKSERKNGRLQEELDDWKAKLKLSQERNLQLENENEIFILEMENSNNSNEKLKSECKILQNQTNQYLARINQLQSALKESKGINGRLQQDFDDCKVKLNHSPSQYSPTPETNQYLAQIDQLQSEVKELKGINGRSKQDFDDCKVESNRSKDEYKRLQDENNNIKSGFASQIEQLESIIKQINEERQILQNKYGECKLIFNQSNHEEQILQWQTEMKNLTTKYDKLQSERDNLKLLVKEIDKKNKILQNNYNKSGEENENLKCDKYLAEINKLESVLKESDRTNSRLQQQIDAKSKHSDRNSQLESANQYEHQININQCTNCEELIKQLQNENVRVKSKIEEITKDFQLKMEDLNSTIEKLKSELNQSVNKCKSLQNENDNDKSKFLEQNRKFESIIKEINEERQILQNKYDECKLRFNQSNHEQQILQWQTEMKNLTTKYVKLQSERDNLKLLVKEIDKENKILQNNYNKSDKENENLKFQCDKYLAEINKMENNRLNSRINTKKIHSKANEKSNYPHESNQTKSKAPIKINYSEDHNKRFMKENDNLERIESNRIGRSRLNLEVERRDRRSFGSESNMSNVTPYNYQNNNILRDPIGFENPKGFCFLNCVIQQLYSCTEFKDELIQYHRGDSIATDQSNPQASDDDKIFVNNFSKLMEEIDNRNDRKIRELVSEIQKYFIESSSGDDVLKCFMTVLTILSNVTKVKILNRNNSIQYINPEVSFENFKNQNYGFVFRSFYGQMALRLVCVHCKYSVNTSYQLFKSVALPVPETRSTIRLDEIINGFLQESPVEMDDKRDCKCPNGSLNFISITEYTHMPLYLHIYLNRGSFYKNGLKNNTHVTCGQVLNFPRKDTSLKYKLISVIDHIGDTLGGHYYAKSCFETDQWWMLNDSTVYRISGDEKIATENTIVFLFKKFT